MENYEFRSFGKIPRLNREIVVTEKIDGTNAQVFIVSCVESGLEEPVPPFIARSRDYLLAAGSRTRWISPGKATDNHGFAAWVVENKDDLVNLGPGRHFGEWWGRGINSGYGLKTKRFSLFNTGIWRPVDEKGPDGNGVFHSETGTVIRCCHVVPVLYRGAFSLSEIDGTLSLLQTVGSIAAPDFKKPEGVIVYHVAGNLYFKKTLEGDGEKWKN